MERCFCFDLQAAWEGNQFQRYVIPSGKGNSRPVNWKKLKKYICEKYQTISPDISSGPWENFPCIGGAIWLSGYCRKKTRIPERIFPLKEFFMGLMNRLKETFGEDGNKFKLLRTLALWTRFRYWTIAWFTFLILSALGCVISIAVGQPFSKGWFNSRAEVVWLSILLTAHACIHTFCQLAGLTIGRISYIKSAEFWDRVFLDMEKFSP